MGRDIKVVLKSFFPPVRILVGGEDKFMKFIKLIRITPGERHGLYKTNRGFAVRKPLGQRVSPYWDLKSFIAAAVFIAAGVLWWASWYYMAFIHKVG